MVVAAMLMPRLVNAQTAVEPAPDDDETTIAPKSSPEASDDSQGAAPSKSLDFAGWASDRVDVWTGVEVFWNVWSIYSGGTYAPFGSLRDNGFRLRATANLASYRYMARWFDPALNAAAPLAVQGRSTSLDMLAGYHWRVGSLTMKAFAGVTRVNYVLAAPFGEPVEAADFNTDLNGARLGVSMAAEFWYDPGGPLWSSLDLGYKTPHQSVSARARFGMRIDSALSFGPEASVFGYTDTDAIKGVHTHPVTTRVGTFVRYDDGIIEVSLSGGRLTPRGGDGAVYVTGQWLKRF